MAREPITLTGSQRSRSSGLVSGFVLKLARQSTALTQERFAEALDVDVTTVQGVGVRATPARSDERRRLHETVRPAVQIGRTRGNRAPPP